MRVVSLFFKILISFLGAGDIESMPFIEALGQFSYRVGKDIIYATSQDTSIKPDLLLILIECLLFLNTSCSRDRKLLLDSCQPCACFKCCWWTGKLLRNCKFLYVPYGGWYSGCVFFIYPNKFLGRFNNCGEFCHYYSENKTNPAQCSATKRPGFDTTYLNLS